MAITYLKYSVNDKYVTLDEPLDPVLYNNIGETYDDYMNDMWVPLSEEQIAFKEANPFASIDEVFNMKMEGTTVFYERTVDNAKLEMKANIEYYDNSNYVNVFYIHDIEIWLDKSTRAGLKLRFDAENAMGQENTILWYKNMQFQLPVKDAIQMLYAVEIYASQCYDNTQRHYAEVDKLETVEEVDNYDYKSGYPEKLNFLM